MNMLIDVRTPEEYGETHIEGAINIPVSDIERGNRGVLESLEKDSSILLYCRSGGRAEYALTLLQKEGFTNVTNLGGMEDVQSSSNGLR